jgi:hypothetical protein
MIWSKRLRKTTATVATSDFSFWVGSVAAQRRETSEHEMTMLIIGIIIGQLVLGFYIILANAGADE